MPRKGRNTMNPQLNIIQAYIFFVMFFIGIIGNAVVIFVLLRQRSTWTITATFLFHLAVADFIFLCFIPFWGHYHMEQLSWTFGEGMCKLVGSVTYINMYASIFFLTAMSLDRWFAIVHAARVRRFRNRFMARCVCAGVWSAALLMSLPSFIFRVLKPHRLAPAVDDSNSNSSFYDTTTLAYTDNRTETDWPTTEPLSTFSESTDVLIEPQKYYCSFYIPKDGPNDAVRKFIAMGTILVFRSIIGFIIPMTVISICYIRIVITVRVKVISKRVKKDRVAKLAAFVIAAFFICWLPYHVMNLYSALAGWWNLFDFDKEAFNRVYPFTICLAYGNSCMNPIVYAFTTTNFQENMKDICVPDNTPRPYKMTLTNHKSNCEVKSPRTQVVRLHTRVFNEDDTSSPGYTRAVKVRLVKNEDKKVDLDRDEIMLKELNSGEGQTFSYYSCPAVMEGLNQVEECESHDCPGGIYSAPENSDIICFTTDQPHAEKS